MFKNLFRATTISLFALLAISACTKSENYSKNDGTFDRNIVGEPASLNPLSYADGYASEVFAYTLETLLTINPDTYEWHPALAERYEISKDNKTYTFYLRQDAKFHDGSAVTAEDVKFSFDAIFIDAYLAARLRSYYTGIDRVEVVDTHTVKFHTKDAYFGNFESAALLRVIPKAVYGDPKVGPKITKTITGSGPYILEKLEKGKRIILKRNDTWHGRNDPYLKTTSLFDRIVLRFVSEQDLAIQMLEKGDLDFQELSAESYTERTKAAAWGKTIDKIKYENDDPAALWSFLGWNLLREPFNNRNVRVALAHLMNRELINEKFRFGMSTLATGPWQRNSIYADKNVKAIEFNPSKAREMLAKEGWVDSNKDGILDKVVQGQRRDFRFTFTIATGSKDTLKYFTLYKEDLRKQGIVMDINQVEWNSFLKLLEEKNFDAMVMSWGGGTLDLDPKQIWHSTSAQANGSNFVSYKNAKVDQLIDQARLTPDRQKRVPILQEVYRTIAADAPYLFLFNVKYAFYGVNKKIKRPKDAYRYAIGHEYWSFDDQALPPATPAAAK